MMPDNITSQLVSSLCPERPADGHKGTFGMALIIAGSRYMPGAQTLAAMSALRSGVGMVRVFAPDDSLMSTSINCPCALLSAWGDTVSSALRQFDMYLKKATAVGIGPGLDEKDPRSYALLRHAVINAPRLVIDAGALNILARESRVFYPLLRERADKEGFEPAVLTPHVGEFRRLTASEEARDMSLEDSCMHFALQNKCVTVAKTHKTIVSDAEGKCYINTVGCDGLAKGGSGDVLTGLITGFLAQGMKADEAAIAGVYLHGLSGDLASDDIGRRVMIPEDIPGYYDEAFAKTGWV